MITDDGARVVHHARGVYIRLLMDTLGTHLDDAALDEVATSMRKLHEALRDRPGEAASTPRSAEPRFAELIARGAEPTRQQDLDADGASAAPGRGRP